MKEMSYRILTKSYKKGTPLCCCRMPLLLKEIDFLLLIFFADNQEITIGIEHRVVKN